MSHPIPTKLRPAFMAHMEAHDRDDLPDGAWFYELEQAAEFFMMAHELWQPWRCPNDAAHRYLKAKETINDARSRTT